MINAEQTIISQYANSPTITALIQDMNEYIDPRADIEAFRAFVWDVSTAKGFGLDIWGKIVGVNREIEAFSDTSDYFGFLTETNDWKPFNEAPFYYDQSRDIYSLDDKAYRQLIMIKALANISRCTVPAINTLLRKLFAGRGKCFVADTGEMTMHYVFEFYLLPYEQKIVTDLNVLPKPAGVLLTAPVIIVGTYFGFAEMGTYITPFDEGPFYVTEAVFDSEAAISAWTDRDCFNDSTLFFD